MITMTGRAMSPIIMIGSERDGCGIQHIVVFEVCAAVVFIVFRESESNSIYDVFFSLKNMLRTDQNKESLPDKVRN